MPGLRVHHLLNCYHLFNCFYKFPHALLSCHILAKDRALEEKSNVFKVLGIHCWKRTQSMSGPASDSQYIHQIN